MIRSDRKRFIDVTGGNLRNSHIYITGHHDFFPVECFGPPKQTGESKSKAIRIYLDGMNRTVETDIALDGRTGNHDGSFASAPGFENFLSIMT